MYNLQGDVVGLADAATGKIIAKYLYDAWGKCVSVENAGGYTIGTANPFRYRGYYYDTETGFYYLNSRYYNPEVGRFINADAFVTTDITGALSANMFAYCENNPVNCGDPMGHAGYGMMSDWNPQEFHKNNKPANDVEDVLTDALIYSTEIYVGLGMGIKGGFDYFGCGVNAGYSFNLAEIYLEEGKFGIRQAERYGATIDLVTWYAGFERSNYQDMDFNSLPSPEDWEIMKVKLPDTIAEVEFYAYIGGSARIGINWDKFYEYLCDYAKRID